VLSTSQRCARHRELIYNVPERCDSLSPAQSNGKVCADKSDMTWLTWLVIALLIATFAALTGIKPKDSRPVAHTRLMGVARFVLVVVVLIVAFIALRARSGG
jgi:hypothetical protein